MGIRKSDALTQQQHHHAMERAPLLPQSPAKTCTIDVPPSVRTAALEHEGEFSTQHLASSDGKTFATAIISFLGSGVLGFPFAFKQAGILLGLVLLLLVGAVSTFCMLLVVECKYKLKERGVRVATYGDIGRASMGRAGQLLVNVALVVSQTGFGVAYLIFIAANAHTYLSVSKQAVVLACLPWLIVFSLLPHIKQLAYVALAADVMNFTGLAIVYATDFSLINVSALLGTSDGVGGSGGGRAAEIHWLGVLSGAPFFFGVASYCFSGIGMVLPLENAMLHKHHFSRILVVTAALIGSIYATFGIAGYLAFGAATRDVVTLNIEGHSGVASAVKLCLCAGLFFAYPMMLFPVFEVLQQAGEGDSHRQTKRVMCRSAIVLLTVAIAAGVPNFGLFISFLGSTCCSLLGFVLPVVFYREVFADAPCATRHTPALLAAILLLGALVVATGCYTAARNFF